MKTYSGFRHEERHALRASGFGRTRPLAWRNSSVQGDPTVGRRKFFSNVITIVRFHTASVGSGRHEYGAISCRSRRSGARIWTKLALVAGDVGGWRFAYPPYACSGRYKEEHEPK